MKSYPPRLKSWILPRYKSYSLAAFLAAVCFPYYSAYYSSGIDESLPWAFNFLADGHLSLGKNILFPHGPLAFFIYPLPVKNNLIIYAWVTWFCLFLLSTSFYKIHQLVKQKGYALPTAVLLLLFPVLDIQLTLIGLTLCHIIIFRLTAQRSALGWAVVFSVFNLLIKTYGGIICCLLLAGQSLAILLAGKNKRLGLFIPVSFIGLFCLVWLIMYHTLSGIPAFFIGQYQLSSDNSEAVSFYNNNNWYLLSLSILSLLAIPIFAKDKLTRYIFWIMLLPFFATWKHAMSRSDTIHTYGFIYFFILFFAVLLITSPGKKMAAIGLSLVALGAFSLNVAIHVNPMFPALRVSPMIRPFNLYQLIFDYDKVAANGNNVSKQNIAGKVLPDTMLRLIGKKTVDIFPWNYAIVPANELNWIPRPVIHSYAAYTVWLDKQNAAHLGAQNTAQFLIWELNEAADDETTLEGIDNTYLLNDGPETMLALFSNYRLKFKDRKYLLFEKKPGIGKPAVSKVSVPLTRRLNKWIDVPPASPGGVIRAKVQVQKSNLGRLKSFFYKGEAVFIVYELDNKKMYCHRFVTNTAVGGLWLNPLILNPESDRGEPRVKRIKIVCQDERMIKQDVSVAFEEVTFPAAAEEKINRSAEKHLFWKSLPPLTKNIFTGVNLTDAIVGAGHWIESVDVPLIRDKKDGAFYILKPGVFSGGYHFFPGREKLPAGFSYLQVYVTASVKTKRSSEAALIISQGDDNGSNFWFSKKISDCFIGQNRWSTVYFYKKIAISRLNPTQPLHFYIWNQDRNDSLSLDNFSVTLDASL